MTNTLEERFETSKKNLIVHHYEYRDLRKDILEEINEQQKVLDKLYEKLNAPITIYLRSDHPIFKNNLVKENALAEWTTYYQKNGDVKQRRELIFISKITDADVTGILSKKVQYVMEISNGIQYKKIECNHYGNKSIIRLSGVDKKEVEAQ